MATCLNCHNYTLSNASIYKRNSPPQRLKVRAQIFRDGGRPSNNTVDANLRVLRQRIEEIKVKERIERCSRYDNGWNHPPGYNYKLKKGLELQQFYTFIFLSIGTVGFTCLGGTILLCLVSFLTHNNNISSVVN